MSLKPSQSNHKRFRCTVTHVGGVALFGVSRGTRTVVCVTCRVPEIRMMVSFAIDSRENAHCSNGPLSAASLTRSSVALIAGTARISE